MSRLQTALARLGTVFLVAICQNEHVTGAAASQIGAATTSVVDRAVRVELIEGIPDQTLWDFTPGAPSETYREPAFGFVAMPARYSPRGVKTDRSSPFLFRASARLTLPKGEHRLLLRAKGGARLFVDGKLLVSTRFPSLTADGHEEVPDVPLAVAPDIRYLRPGHFESLGSLASDGESHIFILETLVGVKGRRPELGELSVSIAEESRPTFRLLSPARQIALTEEGWSAYAVERHAYWKTEDQRCRQIVAAEEEKYWRWRHDLARQFISNNVSALTSSSPKGTDDFRRSDPPHASSFVDEMIDAKLAVAQVALAPITDDYAFLRRVTLDTIGTVPTVEQIDGFLRDKSKARRANAIDQLLQHPGWADHWVSYWQDVLAENPGIVKPMLNNTGPFRWWIHESFADSKPMDRFATELILMEGSAYYGGPAGFGLASENDVPMAQKAQIVAQAFMGMQMQCARCHDAPYHDFKQKDLFSLAAMLKREPQQVPLSSSIPTNANIVIGRVVNVTLKPGSKVEPAWPFHGVMTNDIPDGVLRDSNDSREKLAALITDARNTRFAKVIVNRLWQRYLGWGIVEPVDDWETAKPSHPELLDYLARELVGHDYDLKHVARLILNSETYQREVRSFVRVAGRASHASELAAGNAVVEAADTKPETRFFASPARRRMTAEQIVDSLFSAIGKPFNSEEMNMDVDGRRPVNDFNNLGTPAHGWEFASLSNERDRPALAMPKAQPIVDTLTTFGWREARQSPQTVRDHTANVLQPAALANGVLGHGRITRLSDDSVITALALEDRPLPDLIRVIFLRVLSRPPTAAELETFTSQLEPGFTDRRLNPTGSLAHKSSGPNRAVSWANHLNPEATKIKQEMERRARTGDPPTERLRADWRERMEDALWSLVNSPEFVFVP
jgi:hypothetical protein